MTDRIEGNLLLTFHMESLKARENPELMGRAEYQLRLWLNGLERWQSEKPVRVSEGHESGIGASVTMEVSHDTDVVSLLVQASEHDTLSGDDLSEGTFTLYRAAGFFSGQPFDVRIEGPGTDILLRIRVEATVVD